MKENLIFDLGFFTGDSSDFYIKNGYKVIGVECNPKILSLVKEKYKNEISNGDLIIVEKCITDKDDNVTSFYLSKCDLWCSANKNIAERYHESIEIKVETTTLKSLIKEYGCPVYCKIDIEGNDVLAVRSLKGLDNIPEFISVEAECLGKYETVTVNLVDELHDVGYNHFFFVRQSPGYNMEFQIDGCYDWISYDDAKKELKQLQERNWDWGVWADIYAKK